MTSDDAPLAVKTAIVGKLPTSAVAGAADLLRELGAHFAAQAELTADERAVKAAVDAALAEL